MADRRAPQATDDVSVQQPSLFSLLRQGNRSQAQVASPPSGSDSHSSLTREVIMSVPLAALDLSASEEVEDDAEPLSPATGSPSGENEDHRDPQ